MKVPMHEFTASEIFEALRRGMSEDEARRAADFLAEEVDIDAILAGPPQNPDGPGVPSWDVPTVNFSQDMLILLSLVSSTTAAKVDRYRAQLRDAGAIQPQEDEAWQRRRQQFAAWRDAGYPSEKKSDHDPDAPAT
jgi:hypothetical protein